MLHFIRETDLPVRDRLLQNLQPKNSTAPVSRLYIAPVILTPPFASISARTGLSFRISAPVISTFFRATARRRHSSSPNARPDRSLHRSQALSWSAIQSDCLVRHYRSRP